MLNHVIKDEKSKLEAFLLIAGEALRNDFITELLDKSRHERLVSLEEASHELGSSDLEVKFVGVLFLD